MHPRWVWRVASPPREFRKCLRFKFLRFESDSPLWRRKVASHQYAATYVSANYARKRAFLEEGQGETVEKSPESCMSRCSLSAGSQSPKNGNSRPISSSL